MPKDRGDRASGTIVHLPSLLTGLLATGNALANPIAIQSPSTGMRSILIAVAIVLEIVVAMAILRRFRTPRAFFLWLVAMHVATFPLFVIIAMQLTDALGPLGSVSVGELVVVLCEAGIIYWLCRRIPESPGLPPLASIPRVGAASIAGNLTSIIAFAVLEVVFTTRCTSEAPVLSELENAIREAQVLKAAQERAKTDNSPAALAELKQAEARAQAARERAKARVEKSKERKAGSGALDPSSCRS